MFRSVILEGPDGCGKSTLAEFLSRHLRVPVKTAGPKPKNLLHEIKNIREQIYWLKKGCILDRCTTVCQAVYRNKPESLIYNSVLDYMSTKAKIVFCITDTPKHERKEYDTDEHLEYIESNRQQIYENYMRILSRHEHTVYDWRIDNEFEVLKSVSGLIGTGYSYKAERPGSFRD